MFGVAETTEAELADALRGDATAAIIEADAELFTSDTAFMDADILI